MEGVQPRSALSTVAGNQQVVELSLTVVVFVAVKTSPMEFVTAIPICFSSGDVQAVQDDIIPRKGDHMNAVFSNDLVRIRHDSVWICRIVLVDISAQNGKKRFPILGFDIPFGTWQPFKTADQGDSAGDVECAGPRRAGIVHPIGNPDLIARHSGRQRASWAIWGTPPEDDTK